MKSGVRKPSQEELALINQHYSKRELSEDEIYVFDLDAANSDTVTAYFSRLGSDMIEAFQRDIQKKYTNPDSPLIGYMFGHNDQMIPSGTLFKSELLTESIPEGENKSKVVQRFKPSVFMLKNLNVSGINTDDYIRAYEAGHTEDVSVSFRASSYICDLCQYDIRDFWHCGHIPGRTYVINEAEVESGAQPITKQCTFTVHQGFATDHNLLEVSGVYRGAMWGSKIESQGFGVSKEGIVKQIINKDGDVFASGNIKDFKVSDILRFNYAFDGSIEKVGSVEENERLEWENKLKKKDLEIQNIKTMLELSNKESEALKVEVEKLLKDIEGFNTKVLTIETELNKAKGDLDSCGKNLAQSEVDKVELEEKLNKANERIKQLEAEKKILSDRVEHYISALRERCKKLSIQINGTNFNEVLFDKEISNLSMGELEHKISILEEQLVQIIPFGRKTVPNETVHSDQIVNNGITQPNKKVYKIK